jgi:UDP-hydrolysing UDP-N-acetyl-D-glucosamine 2-epimerase
VSGSTSKPAQARVAVVTGSRSEFGLLIPVIDALMQTRGFAVQVVAAGEHLLGDAPTKREIQQLYPIAAEVTMHAATGTLSRGDYARAVARGVDGFTSVFERLKTQVVLVLGDRIEAFAAAIAANLLGLRVCHIHAGDVAEGIADEAMRHAISRLSHAHACATKQAARRMLASGERREFVRVTGSPAIDLLPEIAMMSDSMHQSLGSPRAVILLHPAGLDAKLERATARQIIQACYNACGSQVLCLDPNHDPGREVIAHELANAAKRYGWQHWPHLPRAVFVGLLKKLAHSDVNGVLVGNSSAGIIEASALKLRTINIGPRQAGRERGPHVIDVAIDGERSLTAELARLLMATPSSGKSRQKVASFRNPYGQGHASTQIAALTAALAGARPEVIRKRLTI